jgi:dTDP-4-amino-4,6-dideoxygalactose transaminase
MRCARRASASTCTTSRSTLQPYYRARGFRPGDFPQAEAYHAGALSLPLHPQLTDAQQLHVVDTLLQALQRTPVGTPELETS